MESFGTIQASDLRIVNQRNPNEEDRNYVEFYYRPVENKSKAVNGIPYFEDVLFVKIIPPGAKSWVDRKARDEDRIRYPAQHAAFINGSAQATAGGFPLEQWPGLLVSQVAFFKSQNIHTVEQLSGIPDSSFGNFPMGTRELRQRAIDFIATAKGQAPIVELRKENDRLREQVEILTRQVSEFAAALKASQKDISLEAAFDVAVAPKTKKAKETHAS